MEKIHIPIDCDLTIISLLNAIEIIQKTNGEKVRIEREFNKIRYISVRVSIEQLFSAFEVKKYFERYFIFRAILLHPIKILKGIKSMSFSCHKDIPEDYWEVMGFGGNLKEPIIVYSNGA